MHISHKQPPLYLEFNIIYLKYFKLFYKYFNINNNDESKINMYTDILKFTIYFEKIISLTKYSTLHFYKKIIFLPLPKLSYLYFNKNNIQSDFTRYKILEIYYCYGFLDKKFDDYKPYLSNFYFYLYYNNLTIYDYDYKSDPYKLDDKDKYNKLFREHLIVLQHNTVNNNLRFTWIKAVVLYTLFIKK